MGDRAHRGRAARRRLRREQRERRQHRVRPVAAVEAAGGGNLVVGTIEVPSCIDPANVYEKFASDVLFNTTNRLVEYPPGATEPEPGLATEWDISDDGLTYTFTLREGVKFQDGSDFDSEDVKYSLERAINVNDPDGASFLLQTRDEETGEPTVGHRVDRDARPDHRRHHARRRRTPPSCPASTTRSPRSCRATATTRRPRRCSPATSPASWPSGRTPTPSSAPARTSSQSYKPGESMVLKRFDDYWGDAAKTETVTVQFFEESAQLKNALDNGEIDLNVNDLGPTERSALADSVTTFQGDGARIRYLVIDVTKPPFDDVEARKALAAAIDRQRIVDNVFEGDAEPLTSMIPAVLRRVREGLLLRHRGRPRPTRRSPSTSGTRSTSTATPRPTWPRSSSACSTRAASSRSRPRAPTGPPSTPTTPARARPTACTRSAGTRTTSTPTTTSIPSTRAQGFLGHYKDDDDGRPRQAGADPDRRGRTGPPPSTRSRRRRPRTCPYIPLYTDASFAYYQKGKLTGVEDTMDVVQQVRWFVISKG